MFEALADVGTTALNSAVDFGSFLLQQEGTEQAAEGAANSVAAIPAKTGAALGIGLAAIGAGYAERGIGAAAVGALAEDSISTGIGIVLTVLPETLVIFALVALFV